MIAIRIFSVMFFLLFTGCHLTDPYKNYPAIEYPGENANIAVQLVAIETWEHSFKVKIRFSENTSWDGLVQEITTDTGTVLVEYFKLNNGTFHSNAYDHHTMSFTFPEHVRTMRLYPGNVEGVDYQNDWFAQLPQNKDGSVKTNINEFWNVDYQWKKGPNGEKPSSKYGVAHETRGKIISDDRENGSVWWSISHKNGIITIQLPDKSVIVVGNTINSK